LRDNTQQDGNTSRAARRGCSDCRGRLMRTHPSPLMQYALQGLLHSCTVFIAAISATILSAVLLWSLTVATSYPAQVFFVDENLILKAHITE